MLHKKSLPPVASETPSTNTTMVSHLHRLPADEHPGPTHAFFEQAAAVMSPLRHHTRNTPTFSPSALTFWHIVRTAVSASVMVWSFS